MHRTTARAMFINKIISYIPMNDLLFHWYENPDESLILMEPNFSKKLTKTIKEKYGFNKDISKELNADIKFYYQLKKNKPIRVKTLKKIANNLKINYPYFDKHIIGFHGGNLVLNIKFPINLKVIESSILIVAFMSDGHNCANQPHYANA